MKFVIATVVLFAAIFGAQSSVLPLGWPHGIIAPHGIATVAGHTLISPAVIPHLPAISLAHGPALLAAAPAVVHHAAPAVVHHTAPIVAAEGTYVAKTRGAVHTAPLAGHINSASSINLEPAPGTI